MKKSRLLALSLFAIAQIAFPQAADLPPAPPPKENEPTTPKAIRSYRDVLPFVPAELRGTKASAWTRLQRDVANAALKESLVDSETPAKLRLKVANIADWNGMTFYADVPNKEGYYIRVFGKFTDEWKQKLATLKKGDTALLEGVLSAVSYRDLWGKFTLSICLQNCAFTKLEPSSEPEPSEPIRL